MIPIKDLIDKKYGRLTIIEEVEPYICNNQKYRKVLCHCDCGNFKEILLAKLKSGHSKSCGCLRKDRTTKHKLCNHFLYSRWAGMIARCYNPNHKAYKNYGGRGIIVCNKWKDNPNFFIKWALVNGWNKNLCIDRIDNNGNYEPDNCRFVTYGVNNKNKRLLMSTNTSGYRGVTRERNKWKAYLYCNSKRKHLGYFINKITAALKYNEAAKELNDGRPLNII